MSLLPEIEPDARLRFFASAAGVAPGDARPAGSFSFVVRDTGAATRARICNGLHDLLDGRKPRADVRSATFEEIEIPPDRRPPSANAEQRHRRRWFGYRVAVEYSSESLLGPEEVAELERKVDHAAVGHWIERRRRLQERSSALGPTESDSDSND